ncbi:MAG: hypothetical protein U9N11_05560, partial [Campylobacterota bacterium]|nr:hypothetical protein [Campylobacterota bacterium]
KMPTCYIKEGTPKTDSSIVVHAKCKNGNIPIDEAKVTLDNTVKSVDYKGVYFSDFIGFDNLQPSTTYKAVLEVVVGGKTIKESVKIKTQKEKVVATPTPTPVPPPVVDTPPSNNPPKWTKYFYELHIRSLNIPSDNTILNLNSLCSSNIAIHYKIESVTFTEGEHLVGDDEPVLAKNYDLSNELSIDKGKLKLNSMPLGGGNGTIIIRAKTSSGHSDTKINISLESLYLP